MGYHNFSAQEQDFCHFVNFHRFHPPSHSLFVGLQRPATETFAYEFDSTAETRYVAFAEVFSS